jgi:hypothetical protein
MAEKKFPSWGEDNGMEIGGGGDTPFKQNQAL